MTPQLPGTGRKIRLGDDQWPVTVTEAIQRACNEATWAAILENKDEHAEWAHGVKEDAWNRLRQELRLQVTPEQDPDLDERWRLKTIAEWLGCWDVRTGKGKNGWAEPVRSVMDIPMVPECKAHGLMHDCPADGSGK